MRKLFALLSFFVVASMVITACAPPATPAATQAPATEAPAATESPAATEAPTTGAFNSKDPTTLFRATFADPETLDPALDYETAGGLVVANVYDTLVTYNHEKADEFIPQLATEWTISDDGTVYT